MRSIVLLSIVLLMTSAAHAQTPAGVGTVLPVPIPLPPIFSGFSNSVIDHTGNVLIFDNGYPVLLAASLSPAKTHVTVISADGKTQNRYDYDGSMQILGVGDKAVYAFVNGFVPSMTAPIGSTITRRLVALKVDASGGLPATLPSIELSGNEDVKLSAGSGAAGTDTIATIQSIFPPIPLGTVSPISRSNHTVRLFTYDGGTLFVPNPGNPISTTP
jgi:hypothetical protein